MELIGKNQKGQALVLFAVVILVLLAVAMLLVDSGQAYTQRRAAQAAADAGALAGAYALCNGATQTSALNTAIQYASVENPTHSANAYMQSGQIVVETSINNPSFFGKLFGQPLLNASARAAADCMIPGQGTSLMPFTWSCRPPVGGGTSDSEDCQYRALDYQTQYLPLTTGNPSSVYIEGEGNVSTPFNFDNAIFEDYIYIIMDNAKTSEDCISQGGTVNCDLNGDGADEIWGGGDRGWLDLNGKNPPNGASALSGWVLNPFNGAISLLLAQEHHLMISYSFTKCFEWQYT